MLQVKNGNKRAEKILILYRCLLARARQQQHASNKRQLCQMSLTARFLHQLLDVWDF